ncbi:MAG TPA: phosphatase [Rubrobacteraceae bacterium]|nr:phosphatase [Rubrobacteraceae bacterium]
MNPLVTKYADRLLAATVAGKRTSHGAENNLRKIGLLLEGDENNTYGMEGLLGETRFYEVYSAVEEEIGNPPDMEETPGRGCIDPARTAAGLLEAGERIRAVAGTGGSIVLATGHPGALLSYYLGLARWVEELGGEVLSTRTGGSYMRGAILDWVGSVGALANGATLWHTHDAEPMRDLLRELGAADLVVADHGFAGAAVAAGIPTVAIMDTNDPAFAVAARRGADLTVIPMDDNRPQGSYAAALSVLTQRD